MNSSDHIPDVSSLTSTPHFLLNVPKEIRASIWCYLEIRDFGSILLLCKTIKQAIEAEDLPYVARQLMKLTDLEEAKIEGIKIALSQAHRANKLFITVFNSHSLPLSTVFLHERVGQTAELQRLININQIDIRHSKIRERLLIFLATVFKGVFTSTYFLREIPFTIKHKHDAIAIHVNDLLENDLLFDELAKRNYDVMNLFHSFGIKSYHLMSMRDDGQTQMEKLMDLCAVFKLFKCTPRNLRQSKLSSTVKELLLERWGAVYKLLSYIGEEVSLKELVKIDRAKRYHMIKHCDAIINLLRHEIFDSSSLVKTVAIRTICNAHKVHLALTHLYTNLDQEKHSLLLTKPRLVEKLYEQSEYLQALTDNYQFNLALLLSMSDEDQENFVNHSREILRLCQFGIITIYQLFALCPTLSKELLKNMGHFSHLVNHWQLLRINVFDRLEDQPKVLEFIIFHVHLLLTPAREGQMNFEEFIDNFDEVSLELKRQSLIDQERNKLLCNKKLDDKRKKFSHRKSH